ncbi:MAG: ribonuclease P protein component [Helicobacteraceae bacterium]
MIRLTTLKKSSDFQRVFKNGKSFYTKFFTLVYLKETDFRAGFVASKKIGNAVTRNRAKRRLRGLMRLYDLSSGSFVMIAKKDIDLAGFAKIRRDFDFVLAKISTQG